MPRHKFKQRYLLIPNPNGFVSFLFATINSWTGITVSSKCKTRLPHDSHSEEYVCGCTSLFRSHSFHQIIGSVVQPLLLSVVSFIPSIMTFSLVLILAGKKCMEKQQLSDLFFFHLFFWSVPCLSYIKSESSNSFVNLNQRKNSYSMYNSCLFPVLSLLFPEDWEKGFREKDFCTHIDLP